MPDALQWSLSIAGRATGISVQFKEVLDQIPRCAAEWEETIKRKYGVRTEALILALKYETLLNSIYSLCDNLSYVVYSLYRSKNLPRGFNEQRDRFLKDASVDSAYSEILRKTDWYPEVHAIRTEATHYLSGFIVLSGEATLGYFNIPKSQKKDAPTVPITVKDIETHVRKNSTIL